MSNVAAADVVIVDNSRLLICENRFLIELVVVGAKAWLGLNMVRDKVIRRIRFMIGLLCLWDRLERFLQYFDVVEFPVGGEHGVAK